MSDLPHPTPPAGLRFKGQALRLMAALLVGLLVMLVAGIVGIALISALIAAASVAALVWLSWLLIYRMYVRRFRHPS